MIQQDSTGTFYQHRMIHKSYLEVGQPEHKMRPVEPQNPSAKPKGVADEE